MPDNKSAFNSNKYDESIVLTIPHYNMFLESTVDLVRTVNETPDKWLDTGCGTGNLYLIAEKIFTGTKFTLADPSEGMLKVAKEKVGKNVDIVLAGSQELNYKDCTFDVITAIMCHHYFDEKTREKAICNCFRMLKPGGVFITFENVKPFTDKGVDISLRRWGNFQSIGRPTKEVESHIQRYGKECFPITITEHYKLLHSTGFKFIELLWASYMQAGYYAIK